MTATTTYEKLYTQRCYNGVPHFWTPQDLQTQPFNLFSDETLPVDESWGVSAAVQRVIALALELEMPVGEWVGDFTRTEGSRVSKIAQTLLKSNIKDETFHFRGFEKASKAYPISDDITQEAQNIGQRWLTDPSQTIAKACFAETGVFLISLAILRLLGGKELANLAEQVSQDESRHVATNRGILVDLGESCTTPSNSLTTLIRDTLEWVAGDLCVPGKELCEEFDFDRDFLLRSSDSLVATGLAPELDELMNFQCHTLPFEVSNASMYTRAVA
jgi:hypothetical protein